MRPHGSPRGLERRRLRALDLSRAGHPPVEVARMVGVDRRSVRRWNTTCREAGVAGLKAKPATGRPALLDPAAKRRLEHMLLKGAKAAGFPTDLWTCRRVALLIRSQFGVSYHVGHVSRLLHALGWSPQRPEGRAAERNEGEIQSVFLPAYAPELNPVEYVWGYLKVNPLANLAPLDVNLLLSVTRRQGRKLQREEKLLRSFIHHSPLPLRLT